MCDSGVAPLCAKCSISAAVHVRTRPVPCSQHHCCDMLPFIGVRHIQVASGTDVWSRIPNSTAP